MQLRKVCNHPNLFEPRPITSPFSMEGITYHTASLVTTPLDYDPFRNVNLDFLNLRFVNYSVPPSSLSAIAQHRISEYQASHRLIEEIDSAPPPPPRIPKAKLQLRINVKTNTSAIPSPSIQLQKGFQIQSKTLPSVQIRSFNNIPLIVGSGQTQTAQSNSIQGPRLFLLSAPNNSAFTPLKTSTTIGNSGVIVTDNNSSVLGGTPGSIVKKLTLTKSLPPVQSSVLTNQRVKIPIGKLLQTSSGQHILVNPVQSSLVNQSTPIVFPGNVNISQSLTQSRVSLAEKQSNSKFPIFILF